MNKMQERRQWVELQAMHLPQGTTRGWMAIESGMALASIFEAIAPAHSDKFMLCYHVLGEHRPRVERFNTFGMAQERANKQLTGAVCIPRMMPGGGMGIGRRGH